MYFHYKKFLHIVKDCWDNKNTDKSKDKNKKKNKDKKKLNVKSEHHTNSIAIISYIFNTFFNLQSAHNQSADIKNAYR